MRFCINSETDILKVEGEHATIDVWVIRKPDAYQILITNSALPRHPVSDESVRITLNNIPEVIKAHVERIDDEHANATAAWEKMGSPATLHPNDVKALEDASALHQKHISFKFEKNNASVDVEVPPQGTALITLEIK